MAYEIYLPANNKPLVINEKDRYNNQRVLSGTDAEFLLPKGIFFVEYIQLDTGDTIDLKDGKGNIIAAGILSVPPMYSPIRCDYGVQVSGDVLMLKGFFVDNVLDEV